MFMFFLTFIAKLEWQLNLNHFYSHLNNYNIVTFPSGLNSKVSGERLETVSFNPILGECLQDRIPSLLRSNFVLTCWIDQIFFLSKMQKMRARQRRRKLVKVELHGVLNFFGGFNISLCLSFDRAWYIFDLSWVFFH